MLCVDDDGHDVGTRVGVRVGDIVGALEGAAVACVGDADVVDGSSVGAAVGENEGIYEGGAVNVGDDEVSPLDGATEGVDVGEIVSGSSVEVLDVDDEVVMAVPPTHVPHDNPHWTIMYAWKDGSVQYPFRAQLGQLGELSMHDTSVGGIVG